MYSNFAYGLAWLLTVCSFAEDEIQDVRFHDLRLEIRANEEIDLDELPNRISALAGKRIRVRGYIYGPSMATTQESKFMLVRDSMEYSPWPEWHNIAVTMKHGAQIEYTARPITIVGTLKVVKRTKRAEGELPSYYQLSEAYVTSE